MIRQAEHSAELRRREAQAQIDAGKSPVERNRLGQFATPYALAIDMAQYAASLLDGARRVSFADPAVGSGCFFSAALSVFGGDRITQAVGVEIDAGFAEAAARLWSSSGLRVIHGDFTRIIDSTSCPAPPDLVLANPPYVRHHHLGREDKRRLQELTNRLSGVRVNGLSGLYVYFLLLATAWMKEGGLAAWLVPSEFMDVNYGCELKHFLVNRVKLIRVHRFDPADVQFGDALVSSAVLVFAKTPTPPEHSVEFTFGGTVFRPDVLGRVPVDVLRNARKWTSFPEHERNDRRAASGDATATLADFFRIRRGVATGDNKFFILERGQARLLGIPDRFLKPILPSPRFMKTTVIQAAEDGYPLVDPQLCLIDCDWPEHVVQRRCPELWAYLRTGDCRGVRDGYLVSGRDPWYRQERRDPAPFLCTYMGRGAEETQPFRFILNESRAIATNLYLMLYPRGRLAAMLRDRPGMAAEVHELLCGVTGHELRGEGRVYGGGLNKIEPGELGRVSAGSFLDKWPELACARIGTRVPTLFD